MVERTLDYLTQLESELQRVGNKDAALQLRQQQILRPVKPETPFSKAARDAARHIHQLREFITAHKRDYTSAARSSAADKDRMEAEVGLFVNSASKQIEVLKNSVLAAQQQQQQQQQQSGSKAKSGPTLSAQAVAHLHATVLILAEQLQSTARTFDELRARRYRQLMAQRIPPIKAAATPPKGPGGANANGSLAGGLGSSLGGVGGALGSQLMSKLNNSGLRPASWSSSVQSEQEVASSSGNGVGEEEQGSRAPARGQQQLQVQRESQMLLEELEGLGAQVSQVSRAIQDIATLNTMFSTAVSHQVEQIEALYSAAVESSYHISRGNQQLRSAVRHGQAFRYYFSVLMLVLTLMLLLFHWLNS